MDRRSVRGTDCAFNRDAREATGLGAALLPIPERCASRPAVSTPPHSGTDHPSRATSVVARRVRHGSVTAGEIDDVLKNPYSGVGSGHEHDAGAPGRWSGVAIRDSRIASHASYHGPRSLRFAQAHPLFRPGRRGLDIDHRRAVECLDWTDLHEGDVNLTHGHRMQGRGGSVVPVSGCKVRAGLPSVSERLSSPRGSPPPRRIWPRITTW